MSEFELMTLRNRLLRSSRNKAECGELFLSLPLGYFKTSSGEIIQEPDEQARGMIRLVFEKFEELGSAYAVFRYLIVNDLRLGFRRHRGGRIGELEWKPASPNRILSILRHPIYAGAYAYGLHRAGTRHPTTGRAEGGKWFVPPEDSRGSRPGRWRSGLTMSAGPCPGRRHRSRAMAITTSSGSQRDGRNDPTVYPIDWHAFKPANRHATPRNTLPIVQPTPSEVRRIDAVSPIARYATNQWW